MHYFAVSILIGAAQLALAATSDQMADFRLAYLYKNDDQISCMAAIIDMDSAFVAANCIDLTSNNEVDTSVSYKIQYTPTNDNAQPIYVLSPSQITIHPQYNSTTLENNVAVIQYSSGVTDDYVSYIGAKDYVANTKVYVRRDFDTSTSSWNTLQISNHNVNDNACVDGSPLYYANKYWMTCTSSVTTSTASDECTIPYGVVYKQNASDIIALFGIYSHSVIYGSDMCTKYIKTLNYYTALWPYLGFAVSSIGRGISIFNRTARSVYTDTTMNVMESPKSPGIPNVTVEGGDLYPKQWEIEASRSVSTTDSSADSTDSTDNNIDYGRLTKGQKIGIGIGVPLGVIIVVIGCIILYHIWSVKRQDKAWDPSAETMNLQNIALEINAEDPSIVPPPYSQANDEAEFRARQSEEPTMIKKE